jgi:hypothetical protein
VVVSVVAVFLTNQASIGQLRAQQKTNQAQQNLAEQGRITDRFSTAINEIASSKLDIRLGGIYALRRIMHDSDNRKDEPAIIDALCAFIQEHAPAGKAPTIDVQAALTTLGTRPGWSKPVNQNIRTSGNLTGLNLADDHFDFTYLIDANLTSADLDHVHLHHAHLRGAFLNLVKEANGADFTCADPRGADLRGANLTGADLRGADLRGADLRGANLTGADLRGADLRGAKTNPDTRLPSGIVAQPPSQSSPKC